MSDVTQWDPVDDNNNALAPDGFPEGMPASGVNDASRAVMGGVRRLAEDGGWFDWGHPATYVSGSVFQVPGDLSAVYRPGRRVRAIQSGTITGLIQGVAVSANTDVTVLWDAGALANEAILSLALGPDYDSLPLPLVSLDTKSGTINQLLFADASWFAAYPSFYCLLDGLIPDSAGASLLLQVSLDGGTSWQQSGYFNAFRGIDGLGQVIDTVVTTNFFTLANDVGTGADNNVGVYGEARVQNLRGVGVRPHLTAQTVQTGVLASGYAQTVSGFVPVTGPINAIRFFFSTGNVLHGSVRLLGER